MIHNILQIQHDSSEEIFHVVDSGTTEETLEKEKNLGARRSSWTSVKLHLFFCVCIYNVILRLCINNVCTALSLQQTDCQELKMWPW